MEGWQIQSPYVITSYSIHYTKLYENRDELGERDMPKTWADIMKPEFEKRVSLPVGDFDLFNGILLNIHKVYGDEGVKKLGRSLLESMHPSQMVKSERRSVSRPIVTSYNFV